MNIWGTAEAVNMKGHPLLPSFGHVFLSTKRRARGGLWPSPALTEGATLRLNCPRRRRLGVVYHHGLLSYAEPKGARGLPKTQAPPKFLLGHAEVKAKWKRVEAPHKFSKPTGTINAVPRGDRSQTAPLRGGVFCVCYDGSTSPTTGLVALLARRSRPLPGRLFSALLLSYSFPGYSLLR